MWAATENRLAYTLLLASVLVFLFLMAYVIEKFRRNPRLVKFAANLPGPPTVPVIGNGDLGIASKKANAMLILLEEYEKKYGSVYRLWFGKHLVVVVSNVKDLEVVYGTSKLLGKPPFLDPAREFWRDSTFTASLHIWKKCRKVMQPLYVKNTALVPFVPDINQMTYRYMTDFEAHAGGPEFDSWYILCELAFDIMTKTLLGIELTPEDKEFIQFPDCANLADKIAVEKMFKPWVQLKFVDYLLYSGKRKLFHLRMKKFMDLALENYRKSEATEYQKSQIETNSLLATTMRLKDAGLTMDYVQDETVTAVAAGGDTIAATIGFCVIAIATHPEVQERLYEELYQRFGDDDRMADADDLEYLPYLEQVLKETERRFTLGAVLFRNVDEDTNIGPYTFPAGTAVMIPVARIHMNPELYPNPEKFNPENFCAEAISKRHKLSFLPFSAGARNCIGKNLAEFVVKLVVIALMRKFSFSTTMKLEDIKMVPGLMNYSEDGYKVSMKLRNQQSSF